MATRRKFVLQAAAVAAAPFISTTVTRALAAATTRWGSVTFACSRSAVGLDPAFNYGGLHGTRSDGKAIESTATDQFAVEMDDFARCILEKTPTRVPGEEGLRDLKIMTAIYESARTGRPVDLRSA